MANIHSPLWKDLLRALGCFAIGVFVPAFLMLAAQDLAFVPVTFFAGVLLGLPSLIVIMLIIVILRASIHVHLGKWCFVAPFLTVVITTIFFQAVYVGDSWFNERSAHAYRHLKMLLALIPIFFGSGLSAALFYHWTRKAEQRARPSSPDSGVSDNKAMP